MSEPTHVHDWQPLSGWTGRYRCGGCRVIAHRMTGDGEAKAAYGGRLEAFRVYVCSEAGCRRGAVRRKPKQLCAEHANGIEPVRGGELEGRTK